MNNHLESINNIRNKPSVLADIKSSVRNKYQHDNGNLIASQNLAEKIKPFISLTFFTAGDAPKISPPFFMPASGQAIITYVVAGQAMYSDSTGKRGILKKDGWSWVISGSGVWYSIEPITSDYVGVQLCIALTPALELSPPQSVYLDPSEIIRTEPAQVLMGRHGNSRGQFACPAAINYLMIHLNSTQNWRYTLPINHHTVWIAVVSGSIATTEGEIVANQLIILNPANNNIHVRAIANSVFVLASAQDFKHDLVAHKNSVHTSPETLSNGLNGVAVAEKLLVCK